MNNQKSIHVPHKNKKSHIVMFAIIVIFVCILLIGLMQCSLTLTTYDITLSSIPKEFDGYKIVHISDYHSGTYNGSEQDIVKMTAEQNPDIICLTGDIIDGKTQKFDSVEILIAGLSKIAPIYAVFGNNEQYTKFIRDRMDDIYDKYGVKRIDGQKVTIYNNGQTLTLFGIADPGGDDMTLDRDIVGLKDNHNSDGLGIILYHRANEFDKLTNMGYQIVLSGHLHGGLIRLPGIGGILSPYGKLFPKYSGGLYEDNGVYLVSNRGIGNNTIIPRMYNPPEVVSIILHAEE